MPTHTHTQAVTGGLPLNTWSALRGAAKEGVEVAEQGNAATRVFERGATCRFQMMLPDLGSLRAATVKLVRAIDPHLKVSGGSS
jgi:hypothetical protein